MPTEINALDDERLTAYFTSFTDTAWRLATLPVYDLPGQRAAFDRFLAGQGDTAAVQPWIDDVVAPAAADGRDIGRVHVIERTTDDDGNLALGDYLRFELSLYEATRAAGEDIRIAWTEADRWPENVWGPGSDFWLFDEDTTHPVLVEMHYRPDGTFRKAVVITEPAEWIDRAAACKRAALAASKPFRP